MRNTHDFQLYQKSDDGNWSVAGIPPQSHIRTFEIIRE